jgi:hypothetical protein
MSDPLLTFGLITDPAPLQVGPPQGDAPPTKLTIVVSTDAGCFSGQQLHLYSGDQRGPVYVFNFLNQRRAVARQ